MKINYIVLCLVFLSSCDPGQNQAQSPYLREGENRTGAVERSTQMQSFEVNQCVSLLETKFDSSLQIEEAESEIIRKPGGEAYFQNISLSVRQHGMKRLANCRYYDDKTVVAGFLP